MGISNIAINLIGNDNLSGAVSKAAAAVNGLSGSDNIDHDRWVLRIFTGDRRALL